MRFIILTILSWAWCLSAIAQVELDLPQDDIDIPAVDRFHKTQVDATSLMARLSDGSELSFAFPISAHRDIEITVWDNNMFGQDYPGEEEEGNRSSIRTMTLQGFSQDGGDVRLTLDHHFVYGYIEGYDETWWVEPAWYYSKDKEESSDVIVYRESDVHPESPGTCAVSEMHQKSADLTPENNHLTRSTGQCYEVELAIASDFSMFSKYGNSSANVENHNIGVINNVNGDYSGSFDDDIEFVIVEQWISTCSSCDPWSGTTDAGMLLNEFTSWGEGGGFGTSYDLAELWTDRDFDGPTIGIAWVNGLCTSNRYHVLQDFSSNADLLRVLTSHEIGHNFSAEHPSSGGFIMSATVSPTTSWHNNSVNDISGFINLRANQGGCFSNCPAGNVPVVDIDAAVTNLCAGESIRFIDRSTNDPFSWSWTFPGGIPASSTDQHPMVTYPGTGVFAVILTATNAAGSSTETFSGYIEVGSVGASLPVYEDFEDGISWTIENPDGGRTWELEQSDFAPGGNQCLKMDHFNYNGIGQRDAIISPAFDLAGYQFATLHIEYAYAAPTTGPGDSLIVYISTDAGQNFSRIWGGQENGSGNFATRAPSATPFTPASLDDWCSMGTGGADCLDLDISNFLGERDVVVKIESYNNNGNNTYLDRIYVSTDCFNLPPPQAQFTGDPLSGCSPLTVQYEDQSLNSPYEWFWVFEDGSPATSTEQRPTVGYADPGIYDVSLMVTNESGSHTHTESMYIEVTGPPIANFEVDISGRTVTLINLSENATSWVWDFGDSQTATEFEPTHTYAFDGSYTISLLAIGDCGQDETEIQITIGTPPTASYSSSGMEGCAPFEVNFESTASSNTESVLWHFEGGTPATSNLVDPVVVYENPGTFDVVFIAMNSISSDTVIDEDIVLVNTIPEADFDYTKDDFVVDFTDESEGAGEVMWHFGDGSSSSEEDPEHMYSESGIFEVLFIASNDCGSDTTSQSLSIGGFPSAAIVSDTNVGCPVLTVTYEAIDADSTDNVLWNFEGGDPATSTDQVPVVQYHAGGTYDVECIVTNGLGRDTTFLEDYVQVLHLPVANFMQENDTLVNVSEFGVEYHWIVDGTFESDDENLLITDHGMHEVTLIASNLCGSDTMSQNITILSASNRKMDLQNLTILPNPNDGMFTVYFEEAIPSCEIQILDTQGRQLMKSERKIREKKAVFQSQLSPGLYFIRAVSDRQQWFGKMVVVK